MFSDLAAIYVLGLGTGLVMGAIGAFLALRPNDGWRDVQKGNTPLQRMKDAGIGVANKPD